MNGIVEVLNYLEEFNEVSVILRLIIATMMGAVIGMDRGATRHAAGLRTFALVCMGSALAQIVDIRCVMMFGSGDPVRLAQGVINGIGFLGVGTIVVTGKSHIRGLTTAATLWTTAVLGISIGSGYLYSSIITFFMILFVIKVMYRFSRKNDEKSQEMTIALDVTGDESFEKVMKYMEEKKYKISRVQKSEKEEVMAVELDVDFGRGTSHKNVVMDLSKISGVNSVEEVV